MFNSCNNNSLSHPSKMNKAVSVSHSIVQGVVAPVLDPPTLFCGIEEILYRGYRVKKVGEGPLSWCHVAVTWCDFTSPQQPFQTLYYFGVELL